MENDSYLDKISGNRKEWMKLRSILEICSTGFGDRLAVGVRQREATRITPRFLA